MKLFFGVLSLIPAVIAYYLYFRDMFRGKTKPHGFSWLVWGLLSGTGFLAQISAHAGIGAWATGLTSVASLTIAGFALKLGTTRPTRFDWTLLYMALSSLLLLFVVKSEEAALWLTLIALVAGFAMNIRKAYRKPSEENATAFWLNTLKFIPAIFALNSFVFLTVAYPLVAAVGNAAVALVVQVRGGKWSPFQWVRRKSANPLG
ncbi:MAG TPA: hypothetical protein VL737_05355 [Candidatus Pristimantibacillus sp.]|nr:hypothetical protein [Candidatus Pristimantibacillus sp.]